MKHLLLHLFIVGSQSQVHGLLKDTLPVVKALSLGCVMCWALDKHAQQKQPAQSPWLPAREGLICFAELTSIAREEQAGILRKLLQGKS